jgi:hypothetical protein
VAGLRERGHASIDDLVRAIYPDLQPALVPMAGRNVRAHLEKLADEGRVRETPTGWTYPNG